MNLFKKYGIKEISDVTFYSIIEIGDEELYIPVLFLDSLKISNLNQKSSAATANGGYGNGKVISWNFGKEATLQIEDALFSAASMSMTCGWLNSKLSTYTSLIMKINMANKFARLNYSIYAYPSPELTEEEWEKLFFILSDFYEVDTEDYILYQEVKEQTGLQNWPSYLVEDFINEPYVSEIRTELKALYRQRILEVNDKRTALPESLIKLIYNQIKNVKDYYNIDSDNYELEVIDRMEKCVVTNDEGLKIDFNQQWENLKKYFQNNKQESYTIYYDSKTMQPLAMDVNGEVQIEGERVLKKGTVYYKWTRTVQQKIDDRDFLGKVLTINVDTFPWNFKIVGETYIREQKSIKDSRYQFIINKAKISTETSLSLQADGEPTTFSMNIDVLVPPNEVMIELKQFDVVEDEEHGGTKILPQKTEYTRTNTNIPILNGQGDIDNNKIY